MATNTATNFQNTNQEITYFLNNIARPFMGGYSGSGENGIDVALPVDTPVYAVQGGTVVGSGYYQGGGVVSVESGPGKVWYYQHLDNDLVRQGDVIPAGKEIGLSGGQNIGGSHPSTSEFSSFPHIEIGINAPWGGIWGGGQGPNVDPVPYLQQLQGGQSSSTLSSSTASSASGSTALNPLDTSTWVPAIASGLLAPLGITSLKDGLWRAGFTVLGLVLIVLGFEIMFVHSEVGAVEKILPVAAAA